MMNNDKRYIVQCCHSTTQTMMLQKCLRNLEGWQGDSFVANIMGKNKNKKASSMLFKYRVTVVKDRKTRRSKGIAFIQYVK